MLNKESFYDVYFLVLLYILIPCLVHVWSIQLLDEVLTYKNLGTIVSSDLKVAEHCLQAYNKANKMLELVKWTNKHRNMDMMIQLYKSLVRPHLEYCSIQQDGFLYGLVVHTALLAAAQARVWQADAMTVWY